MSYDLSKLGSIQVCDPTTREYRLMYRWGAWVTHCKIIAENDLEAVRDAREAFEQSALGVWPYEVALFETKGRGGWRRVKTFKEADAGRYVTI